MHITQWNRLHLARPCSCTSKGCTHRGGREGERELGRDFSLDCYLGDDAWLSRPVASKVVVESLFFCCHCKWLLAPKSDFSDLLPRIKYGLYHTLIWLFSGKVQFALFVPVSSSGGRPSFLWVMFVESCQYQLGSVHASLSCPPGTSWSLTCLDQDFVSFLVNSTLGPAYKFLMILSFSAGSVQFFSKRVWGKQQALGIFGVNTCLWAAAVLTAPGSSLCWRGSSGCLIPVWRHQWY